MHMYKGSCPAQKCLVAHGGREKDTQDEFMSEWEREAMERYHLFERKKRRDSSRKKFQGVRKRLKPYQLSGVTCPEFLTPYSVCRNGFMSFFGIGNYAMQSVEKRVGKGGLVPKIHALTDKDSNNSLCGEMKESLRKFLNDLKGEAEPHA